MTETKRVLSSAGGGQPYAFRDENAGAIRKYIAFFRFFILRKKSMKSPWFWSHSPYNFEGFYGKEWVSMLSRTVLERHAHERWFFFVVDRFLPLEVI